MKKKRYARLNVRKGALLLRIYRKAWRAEHVILQEMLIRNLAPEELSQKYGISTRDISNMYQRLLMVAVPYAEHYRQRAVNLWALQPNPKRSRPEKLRDDLSHAAGGGLPSDTRKAEVLQSKLTDVGIPLRYRVLKTLHSLDIYTIKDLAGQYLPDLLKYRGFGPWCMRELLYFVEDAQLESYFEGFKEAKKKYGAKDKSGYGYPQGNH